MRKTITFKIEGHDKSFIVNELSVKEIISLMQDEGVQGQDIESLKRVFTEKLLPLCVNVDLDELILMVPSEIMIMWDHFKDMNKDFFGMAQRLGLAELVEDLKRAAISDFSKLLAASSKQDT
jgi:uncharacterized protein YfaA (DUF2138 family)